MLVEEAAEVLEITLLAVLPPSAKHLVMIGDHYQLPPKVEVYALRTNHHFDFSAGQGLYIKGLSIRASASKEYKRFT